MWDDVGCSDCSTGPTILIVCPLAVTQDSKKFQTTNCVNDIEASIFDITFSLIVGRISRRHQHVNTTVILWSW